MSNDYKSFIEVQFPVSKISKESYKERKSGSNQTLTGMGKWWGRKPLVLVRASILGLLMPSSNDLIKDNQIFLKILTMDNDGLWERKTKSIPIKKIYSNLSSSERKRYFEDEFNGIKYKVGLSLDEKQDLQKLIFNRLSYSKKLEYCLRPEEIKLTNDDSWEEINEHLGTSSKSLEELINELSERKFGGKAKIGDCFCGGGSIPFEAGRMGCEVYASDLNPLAGLLTWANLNILSKSDDEIEELKIFQQKVYDSVVDEVDKLGIETNKYGFKAKYYLYCNEVQCLECGCKVPLAPNWVVSSTTDAVAQLKYNELNNNFDISIKENVSKEELLEAKEYITVKDNSIYCPHCNVTTSIISLRKDRKNSDGSIQYGLREWENDDIVSRETDVFQERLYCIRYVDKDGNKTYCTPTEQDFKREEKVLKILQDNFIEWQDKGYIPSSRIERGYNTEQPIRERGWQYWHQLYNPRQLLMQCLFYEKVCQLVTSDYERVIGILGVNGLANRNSKLNMWNYSCDKSEQTFANQALNTLYNYPVRTLSSIYSAWIFELRNYPFENKSKVLLIDARNINTKCNLWITDPPYADAVNYHELSEYFLAWDKKILMNIFPEWYCDSKRALAVKGVGKSFNDSMIDIYKNLNTHMSEDGMQIVMFTHQDVKVWAELTMIVWSAGLRVVSAWNIATETESGGLKNGNYVKGTVLLVLKKQISDEVVFQDDLYPEIKAEVKRQIDSMKAIDEGDETNFEDADYLLASYASSMKVITSYKQIEGIDIQYELSKSRDPKQVSPVEEIINKAIKIAYDYLIPAGFDQFQWKFLSNEERFYIKGLELEKNKSYQLGAYQELARGYGVNDYKILFQNTKANNVRLKTPMEFKTTNLQNDKFGSTLTRNVLMAVYQSVKAEDTVEGKNWLRSELDAMYWKQRATIIEILDYFSRFGVVEHMEHWNKSSEYAKLLREVVKNDGV